MAHNGVVYVSLMILIIELALGLELEIGVTALQAMTTAWLRLHLARSARTHTHGITHLTHTRHSATCSQTTTQTPLIGRL